MSLPALVDPSIEPLVQLRNIISQKKNEAIKKLEDEIKQGKEKIEQGKEKIKEIEKEEYEVARKKQNDFTENSTAILLNLYHLVGEAENDYWNWIRYRNVKAEDFEIDYERSQNLRDYENNRVKRYAKKIERLFDFLIREQNYSESSFRNYKQLVTKLHQTNGEQAIDLLDELLNYARNIIPPEVSIIGEEVIDPLTSSASKINEGH